MSATPDIGGHLPEAPRSGVVALVGGSFNPPHIGHALLAHVVLARLGPAALWVVPCADHPFGKDLAPFADRLAMCRTAFRHLGAAVHVVDVEAHLPLPSFTVQTLRAIRAARPGISMRLVVGTDLLDELDRWREPEALRALCELFVVPRGGFSGDADVDIAVPEVSSSEVRDRVAAGRSAEGLLDREVAAYITTRGLYRPDTEG